MSCCKISWRGLLRSIRSTCHSVFEKDLSITFSNTNPYLKLVVEKFCAFNNSYQYTSCEFYYGSLKKIHRLKTTAEAKQHIIMGHLQGAAERDRDFKVQAGKCQAQGSGDED